MSDKLLAPQFLDATVAYTAVDSVMTALFAHHIRGAMGSLLPDEDKGNCHVVILVPAIEDGRPSNWVNWPHYPLKPYVLYDESFGKPFGWKYPFHEIARCKAAQLWEGQNDGEGPTPAHLLLPSDTPYWGGVKRQGIVVAVSGFAEYFDRMAAGMIAEICIALAAERYKEWRVANPDANSIK